MKHHASLNRIYRLVWSQVRNAWVAVPEKVRGCGKGSKRKLLLAALLSAPQWAAAAGVGGQLVSGSGSIAQSGATTTVTQTSPALSLKWTSLNYAANETLNFVQPSTSAIAVNRIGDVNGTQFLGHLNANGQVWLINPNGILFGQGAQVNVGGLVASTLDIADSDLQSNSRRFSGNGTGRIVNQGSLNAAEGGYVALLGNSVSNQGVISARLGSVALGAGSAVTLSFNGDSLLSLRIDQSTLNNLAENKQLIQADGGQVLMSAGARNALLASVVNNSGVIEARTVEQHDGTIILLGGMSAGTVQVGGRLDASAPNGGNGGFIETSAAQVKVANDARVTTVATSGLAGHWLIDPVDFTIAASGGDITGATLSSNLTGGNVTILSSSGSSGIAGDINVNDAVSWAANQLTLNAQNNININANLNASGSASLALLFGQGAVAAGNTSRVITGNGAAVNLPAGTGNFTTKQGSDGALINYTVITSLGAAGSTTTTDLQGMNGNLALNYALGANIDATTTSGWNAGTGYLPIGDNTTAFTGTFDGLGHSITNLTINRPATDYVGLFGVTDTVSAIRNVGLEGGSVTGRRSVGGLVGESNGVIGNSYASGNVIGNESVGGLVGASNGGIGNSYATGNVTGDSYAAGGLVGANFGPINNSYATGDVVLLGIGGERAGGLVGDNFGPISNSHATGNVSGYDSVGGLVGSNFEPISNSYATGNVTGTGGTNYGVGGLVAENYGDISNSYATGNVSGTGYAGGLIGIHYGSGGSVVGNSYATGNVTSSGDYTGGLVGANWDVISASYATGNVTSTGDYTGGLVGTNYQTISNSYATGNVSGGNYSAGGLVGDNFGTISNIYATGNVSGTDYVGGLAGSNYDTINNAYSTGSVSGTSDVGGLLGLSYGTVVNSYWNTQTSGQAVGVGDGDPTGITGKTTAEMRQASTFSGWNIAGPSAGTWLIYEGNTSPLLQVFMTPLTVTANTVSQTYTGQQYANPNGVTFTAGSTPVPFPVPSTGANLFGTLSFSGQTSPNVGTYSINPSGLYSDQKGYMLSYGPAGTLTVTPATLTYTAIPASFVNGQTPTGLTGSVTGFVPGQTLASATTGTPDWRTPATASSAPGFYAIDGSGLTALNGNYVFVQAPGNATALTILPTAPPEVDTAVAQVQSLLTEPFLACEQGWGTGQSLATDGALVSCFNTLPRQVIELRIINGGVKMPGRLTSNN